MKNKIKIIFFLRYQFITSKFEKMFLLVIINIGKDVPGKR
jgi:hypothetical protein